MSVAITYVLLESANTFSAPLGIRPEVYDFVAALLPYRLSSI